MPGDVALVLGTSGTTSRPKQASRCPRPISSRRRGHPPDAAAGRDRGLCGDVVPHPTGLVGVLTARRRGSGFAVRPLDLDRFSTSLHWAPTPHPRFPPHPGHPGPHFRATGMGPASGTSWSSAPPRRPARRRSCGRNGGGDRGADGGVVWDDRPGLPTRMASNPAAAGSSEAGFGVGSGGGTGGGNPRCRGEAGRRPDPRRGCDPRSEASHLGIRESAGGGTVLPRGWFRTGDQGIP